MIDLKEIDKIPPGHTHLCLKCQAPYTIYYHGIKPDMIYISHCGEERDFSKENSMSGCHVPAVGECACQCHATGIKTMFAVNPPQPCCLCEAMIYGVYKPIEQKSDVQHLLERIITLENFVGQNYDKDKQDFLNAMGDLSMRLNEMQSSLREFEKQRVVPIRERVDALEQHQTKQEVRICDLQDSWVNLMAERDTFANRMVDFEERLDELEGGDY